MSYIGNSPGVASQRVTTTLTATAGQTQFTTQSGYVLGYVDVYLNGAKLVNGSDFEAITGTYITLFAGASAGDVVELVSYVPRGLSDGYTKAEADAKFLDVGGDTASGTLALAAASLTGNLTLSGGTANGIGYLNASKVLTTDSTLLYDGNNLTQSGQNASVSLQVNTSNTGTGASNYSEIQLADVGTVRSYWRNLRDNSGATIFSGNDHIRFALLGTEYVRLNSTGVGIGTTSPGAKLDVVGSTDTSIRVRTTGTSNAASLLMYSGNGTTSAKYSYVRFVNDDSTTVDWRIGTYGSNNLSFVNSTAGSVPVLIDTSGNFYIGANTGSNAGRVTIIGANASSIPLGFDTNANYAQIQSYASKPLYIQPLGNSLSLNSGGGYTIIGATPGTYNSSRQLQVANSILIGYGLYTYAAIDTNSTGDVILSSNANPANLGVNSNIVFKLGNSGGGGPGEVMRIISNGYVGIGTSNPSTALHTYAATPPGSIVAKFETASDSWVQLKGGVNKSSWQIGATASGLDFYNDDTTGYRVTISNSGYFGIGTRSPAYPLHVVGGSNVFAITGSSSNSLLGGVDTLGFYIEQSGSSGNAQAFRLQTSNGSNSYTGIRLDGANRAITFQTSSLERMRIDSAGLVGFGVGTGGSSLTIQSGNTGAANHTHTISGPSAGTNDDLVFDLSRSGGAYGQFVVRFNGTNTLYLPGASLANSGKAYINPPASLGIGTTNPAVNSKLDVSGAIKSSRTVYNWFQWGGNPGGQYLHIKTTLWSGGSPNGNSQPTMSLFHVKGYNYDGHTIDAMIGFHNWSGGQYSLRVTNSGSFAGSHGVYTSTDGYVVLVINTGTSYPGISIDYHQSYPYSWQDVQIAGYSSSTGSTGVY